MALSWFLVPFHKEFCRVAGHIILLGEPLQSGSAATMRECTWSATFLGWVAQVIHMPEPKVFKLNIILYQNDQCSSIELFVLWLTTVFLPCTSKDDSDCDETISRLTLRHEVAYLGSFVINPKIIKWCHFTTDTWNPVHKAPHFVEPRLGVWLLLKALYSVKSGQSVYPSMLLQSDLLWGLCRKSIPK